MRACLACLVTISALACSSGSGNSGSPSVDSPEGACAEYAAAYCARLDACFTLRVGQSFGDIATCRDRTALGCVARLGLAGMGKKPADVRTCGAALSGGDCNALRGDLVPSACLPKKGTLAAGTTCYDDSQCASAFCEGFSLLCGGKCKDAAIQGAACSGATGCGRALVCSADVCERPPPAGVDDLCTTTDGCAVGLYCFEGNCKKSAGEGEACDPASKTAPGCNTDAGLLCVSGKCVKIKLGPPGAACDNAFSGPNQCSKSDCFEGKCRAFAADGGECIGTVKCLSPAQCDRGVCKMFHQVTTACGL